MPPTFDMIDRASVQLLEAAQGLSKEEQTKEDKKKLLDGSRGMCVTTTIWTIFLDSANFLHTTNKEFKYIFLAVEHLINTHNTMIVIA